MSVTINAKYPINEETSLLTLKERWKADYKTLLHILDESGIYPFLKNKWVMTPNENIKNKWVTCLGIHGGSGESLTLTHFETTLKDNQRVAEIKGKQYICCRASTYQKSIDFQREPEFECWFNESKGGVLDAHTALQSFDRDSFSIAEGSSRDKYIAGRIFFWRVELMPKSIFFDGTDLKRYEQINYGIDDKLNLSKPEAMPKSSTEEGANKPPAVKKAGVFERREEYFKPWVAKKGGEDVVQRIKKHDVWIELKSIEPELFSHGKSDFFKRQKIVRFLSGRKPAS